MERCDERPFELNTSQLLSRPAVKTVLIKDHPYDAWLYDKVRNIHFSWLRSNPLMVRPKKEIGKFRVILAFSFPIGEPVNALVPRFTYDGVPYKLRLPSALNLAELIAKRCQYCYLYKLDLARAYRQLPSDPLDWPLLGIQWEGKCHYDT